MFINFSHLYKFAVLPYALNTKGKWFCKQHNYIIKKNGKHVSILNIWLLKNNQCSKQADNLYKTSCLEDLMHQFVLGEQRLIFS